MRSVLCAVAFLASGAAPASAAVIDFEDLDVGAFGLSLTIGDVTFASPVELVVAQYFTDDGVTKALCSRSAALFGCESNLTMSFATPVSAFGLTVDGANTNAATLDAVAVLSDGSMQSIRFDGFEPFRPKVLTFGSLHIRSVTFSTTDPQGFSFDDITYRTTAVPEPAAWALMMAGFGLLGGDLRRRRFVARGMG